MKFRFYKTFELRYLKTAEWRSANSILALCCFPTLKS